MKSLRILASVGLVSGVLVMTSGALATGATGATGASASTVKTCTSALLSVSLGTSEGAAGTIYYPVVFTNRGAACAIWGVPAVQPVVGGASHSRIDVGPRARNDSLGQMPVRHVLAAHHQVSAGMGVAESGNYPVGLCEPENAGAIVVSLGTFLPPTNLTLKISVCTKVSSVSTRLIVSGNTGA